MRQQKANQFRVIDEEGFVKVGYKEGSDAWILSYLCQQASKLACISSNKINGAKIFIDDLNEVSKKLAEVNDGEVEKDERQTQKILNRQSQNERNDAIKTLFLDPRISLTKGRKKGFPKNQKCR